MIARRAIGNGMTSIMTVQVLGTVTAHDDLCDDMRQIGRGVANFFRNMGSFVGVPIPPRPIGCEDEEGEEEV
jgi:hypothetical protein